MIALLLALAADQPLPTSLSLEGPQQEEERLRPDGNPMPVMEYVTRYSELEAGTLYTDWGGDLRMDSRLGFYVRWGVGLMPHLTAHVTFRYYDLDNSEITGTKDEHILVRGLFFGATYRHPLTAEFALEASGAAGFLRFDSRAATIGSDTAPALSAEAAVTMRLWEVLRLKAGIGFDYVHTDFHQTSANDVLNLSYLVGFEFGS